MARGSHRHLGTTPGAHRDTVLAGLAPDRSRVTLTDERIGRQRERKRSSAVYNHLAEHTEVVTGDLPGEDGYKGTRFETTALDSNVRAT
jgi:hypothetical protein